MPDQQPPRVLSAVVQNALATHLRGLHKPGRPLLLTNAWDAASATVLLRNPRTRAIATASYAIAAAHGVTDEALTLEQNLHSIQCVARAMLPTAGSGSGGIPLTVDLQDGYGARLEEAVRAVVAAGAVGCNLEDVDTAGALYPAQEAARRVAMALQVAVEMGIPDFVVNARTDVLGAGRGTVEEVLERGRLYLAAGATTVFVWGGSGGRGVSGVEVRKLVEALDGRVNVMMHLGKEFLGPKQLAEIGVARISVGPALWRVAMSAFEAEAGRLLAELED